MEDPALNTPEMTQIILPAKMIWLSLWHKKEIECYEAIFYSEKITRIYDRNLLPVVWFFEIFSRIEPR